MKTFKLLCLLLLSFVWKEPTNSAAFIIVTLLWLLEKFPLLSTLSLSHFVFVCLFVCLFYGTWEFLQPVQCCDMTCVSRWSHNSFPWSTGSRSQEIHRCSQSPLTQFSQDAFTITRFLGLWALPRFYVLKYLWEWHVWWIPFFTNALILILLKCAGELG